MRIFLICPVRKPQRRIGPLRKLAVFVKFVTFGVPAELDKEWENKQAAIRDYVAKLEAAGHVVHWPPRDTDQNDPVGLQICTGNRAAILWADEIHIWYDASSKGSYFDLGMYFMLRKFRNLKFVLANPEAVKPTPHKNFENVLLALTGNL